MWYRILPQLFNMSLTGSLVILWVLAGRLLLKRAPKIFSYALWSVVLFRLVCPVAASSDLSLLRIFAVPAEPNGRIVYIPANLAHAANPQVNLPLPGVSRIINQGLPQGAEQLVADPLEIVISLGTYLWLLGVVVMLFHSLFSLLRLRQRLVGSVRLRDNIYLADHLDSPFVLGVLSPKIYLPSTLSEQEQDYIILHEQTHIRRFDHVVKLSAFFVLTLHWFNPLVWVAFLLCVKDMEMSCDERVVKQLGQETRQAYSVLLLRLATGKNAIAGMPLAFGESDTKSRILNILSYRKPGFWVVGLALILTGTLGISLFFNPREQGPALLGASYRVESILYQAPMYSFAYTAETAPFYCISADYALFERGPEEGSPWEYKGGLEEYRITSGELMALCDVGPWERDQDIGRIDRALRLQVPEDPNGTFYLAMETSQGENLFAIGYESEAGSHVRWLFRMEAVSGKLDMEYLNLSITRALGLDRQVQSFSFYETSDLLGLVFVGFLADGSSSLSDLGFALFQFRDGAYQLVEHTLYPDGTLDGEEIFLVKAPEMLDGSSGKIQLAYDLILSNNPALAYVEGRIGQQVDVAEGVLGHPTMLLFPGNHGPAGERVYYFYDQWENELGRK